MYSFKKMPSKLSTSTKLSLQHSTHVTDLYSKCLRRGAFGALLLQKLGHKGVNELAKVTQPVSGRIRTLGGSKSCTLT